MASTGTAVRRREPALDIEAEASSLLRELRSRGFDLRRPVFLAYVVELGDARDCAYRLRQQAANESWRASLYADDSGWVVRLGRLIRPRESALGTAAREARLLATEYDGRMRGVCVEELSDDGAWAELAERVRERVHPHRVMAQDDALAMVG